LLSGSDGFSRARGVGGAQADRQDGEERAAGDKPSTRTQELSTRAGAQNKGKSSGRDGEAARRTLGKRLRCSAEDEREGARTTAVAAVDEGDEAARGKTTEEEGSRPWLPRQCTTETTVAGASTTDGEETPSGSRSPVALPAERHDAAMTMSSGETVAARRRKRRTEATVAAVHGILTKELREQREERAKVLRVVVQQARDQLQREGGRERRRDRVQGLRAVTIAAKKRTTRVPPHEESPEDAIDDQEAARTKRKSPASASPEEMADEEWLECVRRFEEKCPATLYEHGTLTDMRASRKEALRAAKTFRRARRVRRLQQRRLSVGS